MVDIIIMSDSIVLCQSLPAMGNRGATRWVVGPGVLVMFHGQPGVILDFSLK